MYRLIQVLKRMWLLPFRRRLSSRLLLSLIHILPICPKLSLPQYLSADVPEEQRAIGQISQQLLRRCRMLVVCGNEITTAMAGEIGTAEKLKLICTTLDGLAKIKDAEQRYIN